MDESAHSNNIFCQTNLGVPSFSNEFNETHYEIEAIPLVFTVILKQNLHFLEILAHT